MHFLRAYHGYLEYRMHTDKYKYIRFPGKGDKCFELKHQQYKIIIMCSDIILFGQNMHYHRNITDLVSEKLTPMHALFSCVYYLYFLVQFVVIKRGLSC